MRFNIKKIISGFLIFHCIRDWMQFLGIKNRMTEVGHEDGIKRSNKILNRFGLKYSRWTEAPWAMVEMWLIKKLLRN